MEPLPAARVARVACVGIAPAALKRRPESHETSRAPQTAALVGGWALGFRSRPSRVRARAEAGDAPRNLYELLGLSPLEAAVASAESIKQRQRVLLKVCHPDIAGDGGAAVTALLTEAVNALSSAQARAEYEASLSDTEMEVGRGGSMSWPSLAQIAFSRDGWAEVPLESCGERHEARESLFVDEVACTSCNICVDAAPNTFDIVDYPGGADNYGGGRTARVHTQWGDGEEELLEACEYCPRGCIYWVPRDSLRTLEYLSQAEEYQPFLGRKRKNRPAASGKTNFDPLTGYQVWWPFEEGMAMVSSGNLCPELSATAGAAFAAPEDPRVALAWAELPYEVRKEALRALAQSVAS